MINEEQFEAGVADLFRIAEQMQRADGWRYGVPVESRRQRIKRLRRWNALPVHYPDRFMLKAGKEISEFSLASYRVHRGVELMITRVTRNMPVFPSLDKIQESLESFTRPEIEWKQVVQYNGYCRFKRKPVDERGYNGILSYVPVHGGITYCDHDYGVSVYGFDTAHFGDEDNNMVRNLEWVEHQAWLMARSIQIAALFEPDYLRFRSAMIRAEIITNMHKMIERKVGARFQLINNFGAMINALSGKI